MAEIGRMVGRIGLFWPPDAGAVEIGHGGAAALERRRRDRALPHHDRRENTNLRPGVVPARGGGRVTA
ncbi:hypothetical protein [Nonomuraea diastatica]|uniref:Uncharacterized protein n=1 Tax=Nonomuraea diastatica TaxID=1848329 RepID=A0A4R4X4A3_9ACTN|nr:hypothetical protein [Nonomuraea diastatica]TDD25123.1 hypothetical protein E1294_03905 [Nonomuraea diastatica]